MSLRFIVLSTLFAGGAVALSCRDATQVRVRVVTNLACPGGSAPVLVDSSVLAGPIGKVSGPVQALTAACTPGSPNDIGDVYVFPREEKDGSAEVWVVAGHELPNGNKMDAEGCLNAYTSFVDEGTAFPTECIIAKRRLAFVPHEGLELTILINSACGGLACDPDETCYDARGCVPNDVVCADDGTCVLEEEGVGGGGTTATAASASASNAIASASNARVSAASDASSSTEAASNDASASADASADASSGSTPVSGASSNVSSSVSSVSSSASSNVSSSVSSVSVSSSSNVSASSVSSVSVASASAAASVSSVSVSSSSSSGGGGPTSSVSSGSSMGSSLTAPAACIDGAMVTVNACSDCAAACANLACFGPPSCSEIDPGMAVCVCSA